VLGKRGVVFLCIFLSSEVTIWDVREKFVNVVFSSSEVIFETLREELKYIEICSLNSPEVIFETLREELRCIKIAMWFSARQRSYSRLYERNLNI